MSPCNATISRRQGYDLKHLLRKASERSNDGVFPVKHTLQCLFSEALLQSFQLDPQLAADTDPLGRFSLSRVLLMNDSRYPWLILVPERTDMAEIIDLAPEDRQQLMAEITAVSEALKAAFNPDKLNIGALGNRVRQLHVHVLARFVSDEAWPGPVWGVGQARPYPPHMAGVTMDRIGAELAKLGMTSF
jgi:diadenosine tetraphosphate (Ap4A) HIT family hydrolase